MAKKSPIKTSRSKTNIDARMKSYKSRPDRLHVLANKNGWSVKREGTSRADRVFSRKSDAVSRATSRLKKGDAKNVIIHKKDGTIDQWKTSSKTSRK